MNGTYHGPATFGPISTTDNELSLAIVRHEIRAREDAPRGSDLSITEISDYAALSIVAYLITDMNAHVAWWHLLENEGAVSLEAFADGLSYSFDRYPSTSDEYRMLGYLATWALNHSTRTDV